VISLNIIVPISKDFNLEEIAPDVLIISQGLSKIGRYYLIEVDEEAAVIISLILGKENVWKR
jgi:hypothetical protein